MRLAPALTIAVPLAIAAGCGARSALVTELGAGTGGAGGGGASSSAASTSSSSGGGSAPDGGPPCLAWKVAAGDPLALTDPGGDSSLTSLLVDGDRVFVASTNNNDPSPDPTWRVRVVTPDLATPGPSQVVLTRPQSVSYSGFGMAAAAGHRGGVAWDESGGCRFVPIGDDGAAIGPPAPISKGWCYWPYGTSAGYTTFVSPTFNLAPLDLSSLDPKGAVVSSKTGIVPAPPPPSSTFPMARARFDDGSFTIAWSVTPPPPGAEVGLAVQHFTAAGDPVDKQGVLTAFAHASTFTMTAVGTKLLAFGTTVPPGTAVLAQPLDANGGPLADAAPLWPDDGVQIGRTTAIAVPGGAMVIWSKGKAGAFDQLLAQMVDEGGAPIGGPITIPTPPFLGFLALGRSSAGVVVAFEALKPGALTQVFVTRLICAG